MKMNEINRLESEALNELKSNLVEVKSVEGFC